MGPVEQPEPGLRTGGERFSTATERGDRRWNQALGTGIVIAIVTHLAVLLSVRSAIVPEAPFTAAGPDRGDYRAAEGGGGALTMVEVRVETAPEPEEEEIVEPVEVPVPVPVPEPEIEPETPVAEIAEEQVEASLPGQGQAGTGGEEGAAEGAGTAEGGGEGGGGADAAGDAGLIAPRPRGILIPPSGQPASARGQEITVWVFVTAAGRVLADSTRLEPATSDGRYNNRLRQSVADWVFEPARRAGNVVAAWYPFQIIL